MPIVGPWIKSHVKTIRRSLGLGSIVGFLFLVGCLNADMNFSALNTSATGGSTSAMLPKLVLSRDYTSVSKSFTVGSSLNPAPQASFTDANGVLLTTQTDAIELYAFLDSQCLVPVESGNSIASVLPTLGVSTFNGLGTTHAGSVYLQASSTLSSGDKVHSTCSKAVIFSAGTAHHIVPLEAVSQSFGSGGSSSFVKALQGTVGTSLLLRAQIVDQYGNAVVPTRATSVTFSGFSSNVVGMPSSLVSVDAQGLASFSVLPSATMMPWGVYSVAASGEVSGSFLQPIELVGTSATQILLDWFPVRIFDSDPQYIRMTPKDLNGVPIPSYSSSVQISPNFGINQSSVSFSTEGGGAAYSTLAVTGANGSAVSGVSAFLSGVSGPSGVNALSFAPVVTAPSFDCQGPSGPSTAVGVTADWTVGVGWLTGVFPSAPTVSNRAVIPFGFSKVLFSDVSVGCVQLEGLLQFHYGKKLEVRRAEFVMGAGASLQGVVSASGSSKILSFTRTASEGPGAQRFVLPPGGSVTLTELQVKPDFLGALNGYSFFINGPTSSLVVNRFWPFMNSTYFLQGGQYYPYQVYINTDMTVNDKLTIEYGAEVIVNPGAKLTLSGGAYLLGKLTVRAGGTLVVGTGQEITVYGTGGFKLDGIGPLDSRSVTSGLAVVKSLSGGHFSIHAYSGATLNMSHFYISGLGSGQDMNGGAVHSGLSLDAGVALQALNRGRFESFDLANPVITVRGTLSFSVNHFFDLHFLDHNGTISASSGNLINASALTLPFGIVQSTIVGPNNRSLKDYVSSPAGLLFWSY